MVEFNLNAIFANKITSIRSLTIIYTFLFNMSNLDSSNDLFLEIVILYIWK